MKVLTTRVSYTLLLCLFFVQVFAQKNIARVDGRIVDKESNAPLWGATILLEGTQKGTLSDAKGNFYLTNVPSGARIIVRYLGYLEWKSAIKDGLQTIFLEKSNFLNDEVIVQGTRASSSSAMAYTNVGAEELKKSNLGQDMPILLQFTPSIVTTSDAGAGVGYTGIRIRGSDASRVNVTINGIPVNDSESQGTYWVNMPDFASSVASVQIQRGVGTSTNGAGAFGGSVNMQTNEFEKEAYGEASVSGGSFNTLKSTLKFGSGLLNGKFTLDGRVSRVVSDGYLDRASSNLRSLYVSGAYFGDKSMIRINFFTGKEKTFQSWYGTPESRVNGDVAGMNAYIERNWLSDEDAKNLLTSGRTYNYYTYPNQTDNYAQDHYQLLSHHTLNSQWNMDVNFHYTYGRGYYEEFKVYDDLTKYDLKPFVSQGQTVESTNIIRQKWLDNDFYGSTFGLNYDGSKGFKFTFGGAWNKYVGRHHGDVVGGDVPSEYLGKRYYESHSQKTDLNLYTKANVAISENLDAMIDLQYRTVGYIMAGIADKRQDISQTNTYSFFNPKLGLTQKLGEKSSAYVSYAVGSKEPGRQDFVDNPTKKPSSEFLMDYEAGFIQKGTKVSFQLNGYWMNYKDQLVLTGKLNSVGEPIRQNVASSYRLGLEGNFTWKISNRLTWQGNATVSQNKIDNFVEYITDYDTNEEKAISHGTSTISYSPSLISGSTLTITTGRLSTSFLTKYVGKQYLDNTSDEGRSIKAYLTQDIRFAYPITTKWTKRLDFTLLLNNVANSLYSSNGYTYSYIYDGKTITENFYYPQAGFNFLAGLVIRL
ncbi:TonB-dependent receptor [Aquirufa sp. ROCK-SH2]